MAQMADKVNVLGTEYKIEYRFAKDDPKLESHDGYSDSSLRLIVVDNMENHERDVLAKGNLASYMRRVLRHEIIHCFLAESGLDGSAVPVPDWSLNEEMVDWMAIQFPKIVRAFREAGCLDD